MAFILTQFIDGNPTTLEYPPSWQLHARFFRPPVLANAFTSMKNARFKDKPEVLVIDKP